MKFFILFWSFILGTCQSNPNYQKINNNPMDQVNTQTAIFAGGCFWCTEAVYNQLIGIQSIEPGYIGGTVPNPTYKEICTGTTGHAEAIKVVFDSTKISYQDLLEVFFATHDPTTLNRQGADVGTQYRSEIFYLNEQQKNQAQEFISWMEKEKVFNTTIVTKISAAPEFYLAEDYHKNYFETNPNQGYCRMVVAPKVEKVRKYFTHKIK